MAFLKDLLVMGPARFMEDIYGTVEFANKLKTGFKINGSGLIYGNEGAINITTPTWGNPVNISIASSDGTNSATAATNINGSQGFTLLLPATIKATLVGKASTAGVADSASKLATARTIFGRSFDGTANIEGEATVYGTYTATASARYASGGLEVREAGMVGSAQSDIGYAPTIGFHWGGRVAASLLFHNDGIFYFKQQNGTSRSTIDANLVSSTVTASSTITATGNITSSADIIGNYLCTKTAAEESSTSTSIAVVASNGYIRKLSMPSGANYDSGSNIWAKLVNIGVQNFSIGSSAPTDADYFISQYAGGGTSQPEFYRRPVSALWGYMNGKAASVYAKLKSPNNMIHNSNEICWVPDNYNNYIWVNYRSVGGTGKSTVTGYKFGNANGKTENVFVEANTFSLLQNANMTYNSTDKCIEFTFA